MPWQERHAATWWGDVTTVLGPTPWMGCDRPLAHPHCRCTSLPYTKKLARSPTVAHEIRLLGRIEPWRMSLNPLVLRWRRADEGSCHFVIPLSPWWLVPTSLELDLGSQGLLVTQGSGLWEGEDGGSLRRAKMHFFSKFFSLPFLKLERCCLDFSFHFTLK